MKFEAVKTSAAAVKRIPLVYSSVSIVMTVLTRFAVKLCNGVKIADTFTDTDSDLAISMNGVIFLIYMDVEYLAKMSLEAGS